MNKTIDTIIDAIDQAAGRALVALATKLLAIIGGTK